MLVCESFTYPNVACFGGIMQTDLMIGFLVEVAMTVMTLLEATIVKRCSKRLNAT
jgi:hypothetical protein